jgi:hypothetical protein
VHARRIRRMSVIGKTGRNANLGKPTLMTSDVKQTRVQARGTEARISAALSTP